VTEKFAKYKGYLNECPIYLITSVLDPWIKGTLLLIEYPDNPTKLANVQAKIHKLYPAQSSSTSAAPVASSQINSNFQTQLLRKVHKTTTAPVSDIDRYLDSPVVD
jgi:hypothetical protein